LGTVFAYFFQHCDQASLEDRKGSVSSAPRN